MASCSLRNGMICWLGPDYPPFASTAKCTFLCNNDVCTIQLKIAVERMKQMCSKLQTKSLNEIIDY